MKTDMDTITLPTKEYQKLMEKALRYEYLAEIVKKEEDIFVSPPTRNVSEVIKAFKTSGKYNPAFLRSLEKGLKRSSYFQTK